MTEVDGWMIEQEILPRGMGDNFYAQKNGCSENTIFLLKFVGEEYDYYILDDKLVRVFDENLCRQIAAAVVKYIDKFT